MKKIILWIVPVILVVILVIFLATHEQKPKIPPIQFEGVEYRVEYNKTGPTEIWVTGTPNAINGYILETNIVGTDISSGKVVWKKLAYGTPHNPNVLGNPEWVYVKEMHLEKKNSQDLIIITDKNDFKHEIFISEEVRKGVRPGSLNAGMMIGYEILEDGGRYYLITDRQQPYTLEQIAALIKFNTFPLTLVPIQKQEWNDAFRRELDKMIEIARNKKYALIVKRHTDKSCPDGLTATVHNYEDPAVTLKTSNPMYMRGQRIEYTISNSDKNNINFQVVSVQILQDGEWNKVLYNAPCGCDPCDYLGSAEPDNEYKAKWDQKILDDNGKCRAAPPGRYRFYIPKLHKNKEENSCMTTHLSSYSNSFEIVR